MIEMHEDVRVKVLDYLSDDDTINIIRAIPGWAETFSESHKHTRKFVLTLNSTNFTTLSTDDYISRTKFRNIKIFCGGLIPVHEAIRFIGHYRDSLENLMLYNLVLQNFNQCAELFNGFTKLCSVTLNNCVIRNIQDEVLNQIESLTTLKFSKCDENFFKIFHGHQSIVKITIENHDYTWVGFSHNEFMRLARTLGNLSHLVLIGHGTGSFLDLESFPLRIRILETDYITFNWYVGISTPRLNFLRSQQGYLRELIIYHLPFDFDGNGVLKFIIEDMRLEKLHYGQIPLILNGAKQVVKEFSASEIQIKAVYEMFRQFTDIETFTLNLSETDVASDAIENVIEIQTQLFLNLKKLIIIDRSSHRRLLGIFLEFYKHFTNIIDLHIDSQDRNMNIVLEEILSRMRNLRKIWINCKAPRALERFEIIKLRAPNLTSLSIPEELLNDARNVFTENNINISGLN